MKKVLLTTSVAIFATITSFTGLISVRATETFKGNVQKSGETVLQTYITDGTRVLGNDSNLIQQALDNKVKAKLDRLGLTYKDTKKVKKIHDNFLNEDKYIIDTENETVELNNNYELEQVSKHNNILGKLNKVINNQNEVEKVISKLKKTLSITDDYKLVQSESFDDDMWILVLEKDLGNDVLNPYESIKLFVNKNDGSIQTFKVFNEKPNTINNKLTSNEAINISKKIIVSDKVNASLQIFKPNYFWTNGNGQLANFVRLAWLITDESVNVYIDAVTGENLGGGYKLSTDAKAFGTGLIENTYNSAILAEAGFKKLGYNTLPTYTSSGDMRQPILSYLSKSTSYGFFINCHGSTSSLTDKENWTIEPSDIQGRFNFVFLDACSTAANTNWATAFSITSSTSRRAFLGWRTDVNQGNVYPFCQYFWPHVGETSLYNVALYAASKVPGSGTTPIVLIGDKNWDGQAY